MVATAKWLARAAAQLFRDSHALRIFQCGRTCRIGWRVAVFVCAAGQGCDRGGSLSHGSARGAQYGVGCDDAGYRFSFSAAEDTDAQYASLAECAAWSPGTFGCAGVEQYEHSACHAQSPADGQRERVVRDRRKF